jgi:hypothetical protein
MMEFDGIIMMEHDGTRWNLMEFDGSWWNMMEYDGNMRDNDGYWWIMIKWKFYTTGLPHRTSVANVQSLAYIR